MELSIFKNKFSTFVKNEFISNKANEKTNKTTTNNKFGLKNISAYGVNNSNNNYKKIQDDLKSKNIKDFTESNVLITETPEFTNNKKLEIFERISNSNSNKNPNKNFNDISIQSYLYKNRNSNLKLSSTNNVSYPNNRNNFINLYHTNNNKGKINQLTDQNKKSSNSNNSKNHYFSNPSLIIPSTNASFHIKSTFSLEKNQNNNLNKKNFEDINVINKISDKRNSLVNKSKNLTKPYDKLEIIKDRSNVLSDQLKNISNQVNFNFVDSNFKIQNETKKQHKTFTKSGDNNLKLKTKNYNNNYYNKISEKLQQNIMNNNYSILNPKKYNPFSKEKDKYTNMITPDILNLSQSNKAYFNKMKKNVLQDNDEICDKIMEINNTVANENLYNYILFEQSHNHEPINLKKLPSLQMSELSNNIIKRNSGDFSNEQQEKNRNINLKLSNNKIANSNNSSKLQQKLGIKKIRTLHEKNYSNFNNISCNETIKNSISENFIYNNSDEKKESSLDKNNFLINALHSTKNKNTKFIDEIFTHLDYNITENNLLEKKELAKSSQNKSIVLNPQQLNISIKSFNNNLNQISPDKIINKNFEEKMIKNISRMRSDENKLNENLECNQDDYKLNQVDNYKTLLKNNKIIIPKLPINNVSINNEGLLDNSIAITKINNIKNNNNLNSKNQINSENSFFSHKKNLDNQNSSEGNTSDNFLYNLVPCTLSNPLDTDINIIEHNRDKEKERDKLIINEIFSEQEELNIEPNERKDNKNEFKQGLNNVFSSDNYSVQMSDKTHDKYFVKKNTQFDKPTAIKNFTNINNLINSLNTRAKIQSSNNNLNLNSNTVNKYKKTFKGDSMNQKDLQYANIFPNNFVHKKNDSNAYYINLKNEILKNNNTSNHINNKNKSSYNNTYNNHLNNLINKKIPFIQVKKYINKYLNEKTTKYLNVDSKNKINKDENLVIKKELLKNFNNNLNSTTNKDSFLNLELFSAKILYTDPSECNDKAKQKLMKNYDLSLNPNNKLPLHNNDSNLNNKPNFEKSQNFGKEKVLNTENMMIDSAHNNILLTDDQLYELDDNYDLNCLTSERSSLKQNKNLEDLNKYVNQYNLINNTNKVVGFFKKEKNPNANNNSNNQTFVKIKHEISKRLNNNDISSHNAYNSLSPKSKVGYKNRYCSNPNNKLSPSNDNNKNVDLEKSGNNNNTNAQSNTNSILYSSIIDFINKNFKTFEILEIVNKIRTNSIYYLGDMNAKFQIFYSKLDLIKSFIETGLENGELNVNVASLNYIPTSQKNSNNKNLEFSINYSNSNSESHRTNNTKSSDGQNNCVNHYNENCSLQKSNPEKYLDDENGNYYIRIGDHIDYRYEIVSELGQGSFGQALKCYDHKNKEFVCVKIIKNKKKFIKQSKIEIKLLEYIQSNDPKNKKNIVRILNNFSFRNHNCIVFELLDINLYDLLKSQDFKGLDNIFIRKISFQMLLALSFLQSQNIIHCDLKPENVLLKKSDSYDIKVIDFGSSCFVNERMYSYIQSRFYRAPEIILGLNYGLEIDMWSFGCILAELYSGIPIFPGEDETDQFFYMMEYLGVPPLHSLKLSKKRRMFFTDDYIPRKIQNSRGKIRIPNTKKISKFMQNADPQLIDLIEQCLIWEASKRIKPFEALCHPYIRKRYEKEVLELLNLDSLMSKNAANDIVKNNTESPTKLPCCNRDNFKTENLSYDKVCKPETENYTQKTDGININNSNNIQRFDDKININININSINNCQVCNAGVKHENINYHNSNTLGGNVPVKNQLRNNYPEIPPIKNDGKSNNYNMNHLLTTSQKEKKKNFINIYTNNNNNLNKNILGNANNNLIFNSNNHSNIIQGKNYILSHKYYGSYTNNDVLMNVKGDTKNNNNNNINKKKTKYS